jgi:hypothetical protein
MSWRCIGAQKVWIHSFFTSTHMKVSGQFRASMDLLLEKYSPVFIEWEPGWVLELAWTFWRREVCLWLVLELDHSPQPRLLSTCCNPSILYSSACVTTAFRLIFTAVCFNIRVDQIQPGNCIDWIPGVKWQSGYWNSSPEQLSACHDIRTPLCVT